MTTAHGLTARAWNGISISRRVSDGYVNATAMCKAGRKKWNDYFRNYRSQDYIAALASVAGIPATGNQGLIQVIQGGAPRLQGTWIHPRLAVDLARWIAPAFAVWMDGWFLEELTGQRQPRPRQQARPATPWAEPAAFNAWWDGATYAQRHAAFMIDQLQGKDGQPPSPQAIHLVHNSCRCIMETHPIQTIQDQLAPVAALLRDAADRLDAVVVPAKL